MAEGDAPKPDKYEARLTQAVEQLRGNVKWTLLAFGAIGTTLLAGSQLSNLGKFHYDEPRLWFALVCAMVALGVAAYAVRAALAVAYTGYVELENLEDADKNYVKGNPALLEGFEDVDALKLAYEDAYADRHEGFYTGKTTAQLQSDENWYRYLDTLVDKVLSYIRYNKIRQQAERSRAKLSRASVVAAAALVGFAWAANPGADQPTVLQSPASRAKLALSAAGRTTLSPVLGAKCVALATIDIILLSATTSGSEVVTVGGQDCSVARFTITPSLGTLSSAAGAAQAAPASATAASGSAGTPIIWTLLRPDTDGAKGELIARTIVARDADCPALTINGARWPMVTRTDGTDPDFPIKICEAALPGNAKAELGGVTLKPRPTDPHKILVIGDTGCRITDYTAQQCESATEWPFFRIARAASAMNPDLVIHVGDYHYREKPCGGRPGCTNSPYGDSWQTWNAEFFAPVAPLLTAAPWLMLRGNHEDCTRAGVGWNLLIRAELGLKPGERCPPDTDPGIFGFDNLRLVAPDTASAELDFNRAGRVATYREQIRKLSKALQGEKKETWLVIHQALWVSYREKDWDKAYDANDLLDSISASFKNGVPDKLCQDIVSPMDTYRQWFAGAIPAANPHENDPKDKSEKPCADPVPAAGQGLAAPDVSLALSGDTHTFQMFLPNEASTRPIQLVAGNSGDALEFANAYLGAGEDLTTASPTLFGVPGKLWMRHTFGFTVLEQDAAARWKATLYDADGKPLVECQLKRPDAGCKAAAKP